MMSVFIVSEENCKERDNSFGQVVCGVLKKAFYFKWSMKNIVIRNKSLMLQLLMMTVMFSVM